MQAGPYLYRETTVGAELVMTDPSQPAEPRKAPPASADELVDVLQRDGIEFIFAMFVDLHGKPCAKMVPVVGR